MYVINADGSGARNLSNSPGDDCCAVWSPDDTRLAFDSHRDSDGIYVVSADGSGLYQLTAGAFHPAWRLQLGSLAQTPRQRTRSR